MWTASGSTDTCEMSRARSVEMASHFIEVADGGGVATIRC